MSIEFFQTRMGKKFYDADVPRITKALERIADALEESNKNAGPQNWGTQKEIKENSV
jgi:hypothetical protein